MKPDQTPPRVGYFPGEASAQTPSERPAAPRRRRMERPQETPQPSSPSYRYTASPSAQQPAAPAQQRASCSQAPQSRVNHSPRGLPRWVILLMFLVCIAVFVTCLTLLINYFSDIWTSRQTAAQLEEVYLAAQSAAETPDPTAVPTPTQAPAAAQVAAASTPLPTATPAVHKTAAELWPTTYANNPTKRISSVFYQLQQQNRDIIGWLRIDGVLEEAVVQRDNSYYLTHDALKNQSVTGALFLDELCDLDTVPTQMVIHGHNMKEGAMFGSLKKYKVKDASYYRAHPFIDFNTIYENGRYVIFAVAEVDVRAGRPDYLPFWHDVRFSSAEAFEEYVRKARSLSHYRCNVEVVPGDRLLTLSTCTGTDDNKRLIVMARRIREDENELELQMDILSTSDR